MAKDIYWKERKVLITGGKGFLGLWTIKKLVEEGAKVTCLTRENKGKKRDFFERYLLGVDFVKGDITDLELLRKTIKNKDITDVIHLASQPIVSLGRDDPFQTFKVNSFGTLAILEACRNQKKIDSILIVSSINAYGEGKNDGKALPFTEQSQLKGIYPYDCSKTCADLISQSFAKTYNMPITIVRCSNIYGGGDLNFERIVPKCIKEGLRNGDIYLRANGEQLRMYLYVEDAVDGFLKISRATNEKKFVGEIFNLGMDEPIKILKLVEMINELLQERNSKNHFTIKFTKDKHPEVLDQYHDHGKVKKLVGWFPKHSLEQGIKKSIDWYMEYFKSLDL